MEEAVAQAARGSAVLARLGEVRAASKKRARQARHRFDWSKRAVELAGEAREAEQALDAAMQSVLALEATAGTPSASASLPATAENNMKERRRALSRDARTAARAEALAAAQAFVADQRLEREEGDANGGSDGDAGWARALLREAEAAQEARRDFHREVWGQAMGMRHVLGEAGATAGEGSALGAEQPEPPEKEIERKKELAMVMSALREHFFLRETELHDEAVAATKAQRSAALAVALSRESHEPGQSGSGGSPEGGLGERSVPQLRVDTEGYELDAGVQESFGLAQAAMLAPHEAFAASEARLRADAAAHARHRRERATAGTWVGEAAHERLAALHRDLVLGGRGLPLFMERVDIEMPDLRRGDVEVHVAWIEQGRRVAEARRVARERLGRALREAQAAGARGVQAAKAAADEHRRAHGERGEVDARRQEIAARLGALREERRERLAELADAQRVADRRVAEEDARTAELAGLERERKHAVVAALERKRRFDGALARLEHEQQEHEQEAVVAGRGPRNRERVEARERERQRRVQDQAVVAEQAVAEEALALQRLAAIRRSVPNFAKLAEIEPSRERLEQPTFSSDVAPEGAYRNAALFANSGFTDAQVCGDVRFRMVQALRDKGLHQSPYAGALLRSMNAHTLVSKNLHVS